MDLKDPLKVFNQQVHQVARQSTICESSDAHQNNAGPETLLDAYNTASNSKLSLSAIHLCLPLCSLRNTMVMVVKEELAEVVVVTERTLSVQAVNRNMLAFSAVRQVTSFERALPSRVDRN